MIVYAVYEEGLEDFVCLFETREEAERYISMQRNPEDFTWIPVQVFNRAEDMEE